MMTGRILLVDDDDLLRELLSSFLTLEGYSVTEAEDGRKALAILATNSFDLILLDLLMPVMDGVRFLKERVEHTTPVIVLSASAEGTVVQAAKAAGVVEILRKPMAPALLLESIAKALATP